MHTSSFRSPDISWRVVTAATIAILTGGCASVGGERPPAVSSSRLGAALDDPGRPAASGGAPPQQAEAPRGVLSLERALALVARRNPRMKASYMELRARQAEQGQAGAIPNPEISLQMEDWLGSGAMRNVRSMQLTVGISQQVELGGKRAARLEVAGAALREAAWAHELLRLNVLGRARAAFTRVLHAQQALALARELARVASETSRLFKEQEAAGRMASLSRSRGQVAAALATMEVGEAENELRRRRLELAGTWGADAAVFERAEGRLVFPQDVPPLDGLAERLRRSARLRSRAAAVARQQALVTRSRAAAWPDLTVEAGYRYFNATEDSAVVLGLGVPLPVFDRNQGASAAARRRAAATGVEAAADHARLTARLKQLHAELRAAHRQAGTLAKVLDQARTAHQAIKAGQALGRFGYLDLLAAQRSLFEVERRHLDVLSRYHLAAAALEELLGAPLPVASAAQGGPAGRSLSPRGGIR